MFTCNRKCVLNASQTVFRTGLIPTDWGWQRSKNYLWLIMKPSFCDFSSLRVKLFSNVRVYKRLQQIGFQQLQPPVEHLDNMFRTTTGSEPHPTLRSPFYSVTSSVGRKRTPYKLSRQGDFPRCFWTHGGLLHCRLRERTPPPHVLEQEPNFDQDPQLPSCPWGSWLDLQMQWPLKHHCRDDRQERKWQINESDICSRFSIFHPSSEKH